MNLKLKKTYKQPAGKQIEIKKADYRKLISLQSLGY